MDYKKNNSFIIRTLMKWMFVYVNAWFYTDLLPFWLIIM